MKRFLILLIVAAFTLLAAKADAQFNWVTANQGTFYWDAVTTDGDGDPWPAGTHVEYRSYYVNSLTDPGKTNPIQVEQTTLTESTVTFPGKGRYWVGCSTHLIDDTTGEVLQSSQTISWSDVPADCLNGEVFGFQLFGLAPSPGNLRPPTP